MWVSYSTRLSVRADSARVIVRMIGKRFQWVVIVCLYICQTDRWVLYVTVIIKAMTSISRWGIEKDHSLNLRIRVSECTNTVNRILIAFSATQGLDRTRRSQQDNSLLELLSTSYLIVRLRWSHIGHSIIIALSRVKALLSHTLSTQSACAWSVCCKPITTNYNKNQVLLKLAKKLFKRSAVSAYQWADYFIHDGNAFGERHTLKRKATHIL